MVEFGVDVDFRLRLVLGALVGSGAKDDVKFFSLL